MKDVTRLISRREFIKILSFTTAGLSIPALSVHADDDPSPTRIRFGIVTDSHYGDRDHERNRYFRESVVKMNEFVKQMNKENVDFVVEIGDFKDQGNPPAEESTISYLRTIEQEFQKFKGNKYHVLGNHDVDSISKDQFLAIVTNTNISQESKYYSFDMKGLHFIVLDANFSSDGLDYNAGNFDWTDANIPQAELNWLERDLTSTSKPSVVFVHQQLDGQGNHYIKNAADVRVILQKEKKVLAVFQGHNHAGQYSFIEGIHYYTLKAMVEGTGEKNNSYAIIEIHDDYGIAVTGYRKALSKKLEKA
jgi:predicted MPP superfamily phosphohydrolase